MKTEDQDVKQGPSGGAVCTCPFRWTTHYRSCPFYIPDFVYYVESAFGLPTTCNCTQDGLPYCGRPECDIDWCWYCGDEYSEPCPRHKEVGRA